MASETAQTAVQTPQSIWGPEWGRDALKSLDRSDLELPAFDVEYLYTRICRERPDLGWTKADFDAAVREYKVLWANMKAASGQFFLVPQKADIIWHQHLLFTHNYADDCNAFFGKFLHHHPEEGEGARAPECSGCPPGQCISYHNH